MNSDHDEKEANWPGRSTEEGKRLWQDALRREDWKRFGPYLSERQWGTVREDYSPDGSSWDYFDHDQARSRAYRWGEDGLLGLTDRQCRLCFSIALWNGNDPYLKERLFGLTNHQGNHGEDVKEYYFYLDSTPTHSYMKALYKYPQSRYPYEELVDVNRRLSRLEPEFELIDTGVMLDDNYFDVQVEYAKKTPNDIFIKITCTNRGAQPRTLHLLPQLWYRNTWAWARDDDGYFAEPSISLVGDKLKASHESLGDFYFSAEQPAEVLFTDNETNMERLFGVKSRSKYVKDAFHRYIVKGEKQAVNPARKGTKAALHYVLLLNPYESKEFFFRLSDKPEAPGSEAKAVFQERLRDADDYYNAVIPKSLSPEIKGIDRQAYASLLFSKQFYYYVVKEWLEGDSNSPAPQRKHPINTNWKNIFNRDIISMPDKWEYPWYAIWDTAFHMIVMAKVDPYFAKEQMVLFLREWYMRHDGQLPAYEFNFSDVNPPVHAWAAYRIYKMTAPKEERDRVFLARIFQKLLINFTWWVNRKDIDGNDLFGGGFLGLDNIGLFDRSREADAPMGGLLEQADGTAWMSFYCTSMLGIALELAGDRPAYEDVASKFFEHFVQIADAVHGACGEGLWCEDDGFYYDQLVIEDQAIPLRIRSIVGLIPLLAVEVIKEERIKSLPGFYKRMRWFIKHRQYLEEDLAKTRESDIGPLRLLALVSKDKLTRILKYMLDENEFLSPYGIRSLSRIHEEHPYSFCAEGHTYTVSYVPAESETGAFGGNSNWRGPIWLPLNFLLIEALERYHKFYGDEFTVECPVGSGQFMNLQQVALEIGHRIASLFLKTKTGFAPWQEGQEALFASEHCQDLHLFYEHFHADSGRGLGASHQTGWTALITRLFDDFVRRENYSQSSTGGKGK
ncbi:MAG TPA: hypothetical protein PL012_08050 [Candidatus Obscuribacter sp.]|nr:hypothetical protein [Candidatus Obscuribacter sp.]